MYSSGIFDKAIAKIEKEDQEKTDAINLLNELHEREAAENKRNSLHQKHLLAAQKEADQMLKSMTNEAEMTAQEKLESIVSDQLKQEEDEKKQKELQEPGVDGFLSSINKISREEKEENDNNRELALKQKVQAVVAPKMAQEALSQALNIKQQEAPISSNSLADMKKRLASKIQAPASAEVSVAQTDLGEGSALDQFDKLRAYESKEAPEKQKEENVDGEEPRRRELDPDSAKQLAAHHRQASPSAEFQAEMQKEIDQDDTLKEKFINEDQKEVKKSSPKPQQMDDDIDNPIAALTALKHPEIMDHAKQFNYDDDMFSHYNNGVTFA